LAFPLALANALALGPALAPALTFPLAGVLAVVKRRAGSGAWAEVPEAKLVKLADKISNLRDVAASPPAHWPVRRQREYFDWAKNVVDALRGVHPKLEKLFDAAYAGKP